LRNVAGTVGQPVQVFRVSAQPGLMLYDYSADEIGHCTNLYPTIRQWAKNMHQAGIKN
jgi:hypothetical protein